MTFDELNKMTFDISDKVRHFQTFAELFKLAVFECDSLQTQQERMPGLEDIAALATMLGNQADIAVEKLIQKLPSSSKGITP
jgi:hypothetical protein